jgi:hypothetical protein
LDFWEFSILSSLYILIINSLLDQVFLCKFLSSDYLPFKLM